MNRRLRSEIEDKENEIKTQEIKLENTVRNYDEILSHKREYESSN